MARDPKVDAVFCSNDMIALGALFEARRLGINVLPKQLKICVFGDLEFCAASEPLLTTMRPPRRKIGVQIAKLLRARLEGTTQSGGSSTWAWSW